MKKVTELVAELALEALLGSSSPLYAKLYQQGLINRSFSYGYESYPGCAFLCAGGESKDPQAVRDAVAAEAQRLCHEGIDDQLWQRIKKGAYGAKVRGLNSFENLCIGQAQAFFAGSDYLRFADLFAAITRQEAAVMLARAYRLYSGEIHDDAEPLTYADKGEIADWAMTDVQLMTHLGIMNGVGENQFAPKSSYSVEQCLVTLVRLYEATCQGKTPDQTNPFVMTEREQAMGKAWTAGLYYVTSAEQGGTLAVARRSLCRVDGSAAGLYSGAGQGLERERIPQYHQV